MIHVSVEKVDFVCKKKYPSLLIRKEEGMSKFYFYWNGLVHIGLIFFLMMIKSHIEDKISEVMRCAHGEDYRLLLTVCGLLLAGAIPGFFTIKYKGTFKCNGERSLKHFFVANVTVLLTMFVIGSLLLVIVACLRTYSITSGFGIWPFVLVCLLYVSLVLYDFYDLMRLPTQKNVNTT